MKNALVPPGSGTRSLKNFAWTALGNAFYAASQWVVLVILARLGSQEQVGEFALATAIATPVFALANLKLRSVQATDALDEYPFGTYLALRIITSVLAFAIVGGVIYIGDFSGPIAWVIAVVALAKTIESGSDIFHGLQQRHEHMEVVSKSLLIKGLLSIGLFTVTYLITGSLVGGVIGLTMAWGVTLLCFDVPMGKIRLSTHVETRFPRAAIPKWDCSDIWSLAWLSAPLGATVAIGSLASNVPRYFAGGMLSAQELGVFAAISYVMVAGNLVISAISQSATPRSAVFYRKSNRRAHFRLVTKLLVMGGAVGVSGVVLVILAGDLLLRTVYGPEYAGYETLFILIMINAAISYSYVFLGTALTSMKKFNVQLPVHVAGLIILVIVSFLFVPGYRLNGIAHAMIITNVFHALAYGIVFLWIQRMSQQTDPGPL